MFDGGILFFVTKLIGAIILLSGVILISVDFFTSSDAFKKARLKSFVGLFVILSSLFIAYCFFMFCYHLEESETKVHDVQMEKVIKESG